MSHAPHVFVVDDETAAREMVGDYLRMHGFEVTLCDGGVDLRLALARDTPDLIILDLNMPEEDGLSVIRFLRERWQLPVIMLTASASPTDRVVGLELGADDYIAKPCELRELLARVRSVLRRLKYAPSRQTSRRLAAIVSFDFVSYGRFIHDDEASTLAAFDAIFGEVITPSLGQYHGVLFKMLGDGALIEFPSVTDAVEWSLWFQTSIREDPRTRLPIGTIRFRVGVAVGDVVLNQNDRMGVGVTMAVRVQECAEQGGVALSDIAFEMARGKFGGQFADGGARALKNIATPMRVFVWPTPESG